MSRAEVPAAPLLRVLSLGAGVQSTALLILAAQAIHASTTAASSPSSSSDDSGGPGGPLLAGFARLDAAVFADTGWEPPAVYEHLARLEREVAGPAGIPVYRVSAGNIRADALDPRHRFASMPLYVAHPGGGEGMGRRQCTSEYKLTPIRRKVRELLGAAPGPGGVPGRVKGRAWAQQWIGISADEADRAEGIPAGEPAYTRSVFPLLDLGLTRQHCQAINTAHGFGQTTKSACIGCPYRTNREWRHMRDHAPADFADAVAFDHAIRHGFARATATGNPLRGEMFLHRTRVPLDLAPIDKVTAREWATRQGDLVHLAAITEFEESLATDHALTGCSPFACRGPA